MDTLRTLGASAAVPAVLVRMFSLTKVRTPPAPRSDLDGGIRWNCAESLGTLGEAAGNAAAFALAKALLQRKPGQVASETYVRTGLAEILAFLGNETDVRWRCAMSLGKLGPVAGKEGAAALLKAHSDQILAVREHAMRAANMLVTRCLDVLDELVHPYVRGQACWVLGSIGPREEAVEALVAVLLREEISGARRREVARDTTAGSARLTTHLKDVYLRRRAAEALGCQGAAVGALGALALKRAAEEDPDVYVQWHAAEVFARLPAKLQAAAETAEAAEQLKALAPPEPPPEFRPPELSTPKESQVPSAPPSPVVPANLDALDKSDLSPKTPIDADSEVIQSFLDPVRTREVFRVFSEGGEINRDDLEEALRMLDLKPFPSEAMS
eukprot:g10100.t1